MRPTFKQTEISPSLSALAVRDGADLRAQEIAKRAEDLERSKMIDQSIASSHVRDRRNRLVRNGRAKQLLTELNIQAQDPAVKEFIGYLKETGRQINLSGWLQNPEHTLDLDRLWSYRYCLGIALYLTGSGFRLAGNKYLYVARENEPTGMYRLTRERARALISAGVVRTEVVENLKREIDSVYARATAIGI